MNYLSLFSGVGGFELGINRAFGDSELRQGRQDEGSLSGQDKPNPSREPNKRQSAACIGYSEIDKYAIATYEHNWKGHRNYGDATKIDERQLPDFELLVGGFPCQAFSVAGKRKGFDEARGTLFFDIARILAHKRPRHLVLENVKGLLSHDGGKTLQTIAGVLTDLGYRIEWQVLNAKNFGVPQNRERIFIVGHLGGECTGQVFPISGGNSQAQSTVHPALDANYYKGPSNQRRMIKQMNNPTHSNDRVYGDDGISPTLNTAQGGNRQPFVAKETRIRRLTPTECERLMSWPDGWTIGSDTQRYKQCGNGVVSNVVQAVISKMLSEDCL